MPRTILLIEYQPRSVDHIRRLLEEQDYRVEVARDGAAGIEAFRDLEPDLTLIASMLPKRSGLEVCRELKDTARGERAPIIVITSRKRKANGEDLEASGCDDHLQRPVRERTLLTKIRALLDAEITDSARGAPEEAQASEFAVGSFDYAAMAEDGPGDAPPPLDLTEAEINDYLADVLPEETPAVDVASTAACENPEATAAPVEAWFDAPDGIPETVSPGEQGRVADASVKRRLVTGDLESLGLAEITQTLSLNRKTACVILRHDGREGRIWFEDGKVRHAVAGGMEAEPAFFEMVRWATGEFAIDHEVTCAARTLDQDAMYLVMEGTRIADESKNGVLSSLPSVPLAVPVAEPPATRREHRLCAPPPPKPQRAGIPRGGAATFVRERGPVYRVLGLAVLAAVSVAAGYYLTRDVADDNRTAVPAAEASSVSPDFVFDESRWMEDLEVEEAGHRESEDAGEPEPPGPIAESTRGARPSTGKSRDSPPDDAPGAVDLASEGPVLVARASGEILAAAAAVAATTPATTRPPDAVEIELPERSGSAGPTYLDLAVKSHVDSGTLTLLVDGVEVYSRVLSAEGKQARRFFKRVEAFDARIEVTPGPHEVVARIALEDGAGGFEDRVVVDLEPGQPRKLQVVAGKTRGRPVALKSR